MKNAFWFILKALLVLKIFKSLSLLFGDLEETAWLDKVKVKIKLISKYMMSQRG